MGEIETGLNDKALVMPPTRPVSLRDLSVPLEITGECELHPAKKKSSPQTCFSRPSPV